LPDTIFQLIAAGAFGSSIVPVLSGIFARGEDERGWRIVSTLINVMLIVLGTLAAVLAIFAPQIVPLVTPGFDAVGTELTIRLTRILLLSPVLLALAAVASSTLNVRGRFAAAAIAPSLYNVSIIVGAVVLGPILGVEGLAVGVVVGSLIHLAVQIRPLVSERFHLSLRIDLGDPAVRQIMLLMVPRAIGLGANQIVFMVATMLASGVDFLLEGLYASKKISRSEERGYHGADTPVRKPVREVSVDDEPRVPGGGRKKYYN